MKIIISFALLCFMHGAFAMKSLKRSHSNINVQEYYREQEAEQDKQALRLSKTKNTQRASSRHFNIPKLDAIQE